MAPSMKENRITVQFRSMMITREIETIMVMLLVKWTFSFGSFARRGTVSHAKFAEDENWLNNFRRALLFTPRQRIKKLHKRHYVARYKCNCVLCKCKQYNWWRRLMIEGEKGKWFFLMNAVLTAGLHFTIWNKHLVFFCISVRLKVN